jgi:hypothetical protein
MPSTSGYSTLPTTTGGGSAPARGSPSRTSSPWLSTTFLGPSSVLPITRNELRMNSTSRRVPALRPGLSGEESPSPSPPGVEPRRRSRSPPAGPCGSRHSGQGQHKPERAGDFASPRPCGIAASRCNTRGLHKRGPNNRVVSLPDDVRYCAPQRCMCAVKQNRLSGCVPRPERYCEACSTLFRLQ